MPLTNHRWFSSPLNPDGWLDRSAVAIASLGAAIRSYWLGLLLILLFAVQLGWLPAMGARTTAHHPAYANAWVGRTRIADSHLQTHRTVPFDDSKSSMVIGKRYRFIN